MWQIQSLFFLVKGWFHEVFLMLLYWALVYKLFWLENDSYCSSILAHYNDPSHFNNLFAIVLQSGVWRSQITCCCCVSSGTWSSSAWYASWSQWTNILLVSSGKWCRNKYCNDLIKRLPSNRKSISDPLVKVTFKTLSKNRLIIQINWIMWSALSSVVMLTPLLQFFSQSIWCLDWKFFAHSGCIH